MVVGNSPATDATERRILRSLFDDGLQCGSPVNCLAEFLPDNPLSPSESGP